MKTTIKLFSALVLSVGFAACGAQELAENESVDENGEAVEAAREALQQNVCVVQSSTSNVMTGYCWITGSAAYRPNMCTPGLASGTPVYSGMGTTYVNQKFCR